VEEVRRIGDAGNAADFLDGRLASCPFDDPEFEAEVFTSPFLSRTEAIQAGKPMLD
jgi:hypothetical protein